MQTGCCDCFSKKWQIVLHNPAKLWYHSHSFWILIYKNISKAEQGFEGHVPSTWAVRLAQNDVDLSSFSNRTVTHRFVSGSALLTVCRTRNNLWFFRVFSQFLCQLLQLCQKSPQWMRAEREEMFSWKRVSNLSYSAIIEQNNQIKLSLVLFILSDPI